MVDDKNGSQEQWHHGARASAVAESHFGRPRMLRNASLGYVVFDSSFSVADLLTKFQVLVPPIEFIGSDCSLP